MLVYIFTVLFILEYLVIKCSLYLKVLASCSHERQASVTLEIPQQSADSPELEDDTEEVSGRKDDMKLPLIP